MHRLLPHLLLALQAAPTAQQRTYYISPSGSDAAPGTSPSTAWLTAARASQLILQPGDAVLFEAGATPHELGGAGLLVRGAGPVRVAAYGGGGARALLHVDAHLTFGVRATDVAGGVEVSNLTLLHTGADKALFNGVEALSTGAAARLPGAVSLHDLEAGNFSTGVYIGAAGCGGFSSVRIARATAWGSLASGIASEGAYGAGCKSHADVEVSDCTARDNPGDAANARSWSGSGIVLSGIDGALITRSTAYRNGGRNGHAGGGPVGIWLWNTHNGTISHSLAFANSNGHPSGSSNDGGGFDLDGGCSACVIEYCLSYNNSGPGFLVCSFGGPDATVNNTVRYSVSYNDGRVSGNGAAGVNFFTPDALAGLAIYGNTLVSSHPTLPLLAPTPFGVPASRVSIASNALLALNGAPLLAMPPAQSPAGVAVSGNAYWGGRAGAFAVQWQGMAYASLEAFRAGSGQERTPQGAPTGSDSDPHAAPSAFFAPCVPAAPAGEAAIPSIPNSPVLDAMRGFSGC